VATTKKQPNCRVLHFGDKWWTTEIHIDIDRLRMCYADDNRRYERNRWFHIIERLLGMPQRLYLESGVQQLMMRKIITDRVRAAIQERYGDWLDEHPFDFRELVFVFETVANRDGPLQFSDRVLA